MPETDPTRPLRVLEICTQFGVGGITRHVLLLAAWLRARGHQVTLAGTPDAWAGPETEPGFLALPTRWVAEDGGAVPARLLNAGRAAWVLRRFLARHPVDVIHAHESAPALVARLARIGLRVPLAVTFHGADPPRVPQFARIARGAERVVALSDRSASALVAGGVKRARLAQIGLGVPVPPPCDPGEVARLRAALLGDGRHLVVSVLRFTPQKGVDILIEVVARLKATRPEIRFALVGDGPLFAEMQALARARGVLSHLVFAGRSAVPHLHLAAADLFLLTSRWEARPLTIVEAFQAGRPVVATDCGGVTELVDASVGAVVPVGEVTAIADAVAGLLGDPGRLAATSAAALARSREPRFDPDEVHGRIEALYRELAGR